MKILEWGKNWIQEIQSSFAQNRGALFLIVALSLDDRPSSFILGYVGESTEMGLPNDGEKGSLHFVSGRTSWIKEGRLVTPPEKRQNDLPLILHDDKLLSSYGEILIFIGEAVKEAIEDGFIYWKDYYRLLHVPFGEEAGNAKGACFAQADGHEVFPFHDELENLYTYMYPQDIKTKSSWEEAETILASLRKISDGAGKIAVRASFLDGVIKDLERIQIKYYLLLQKYENFYNQGKTRRHK